MFRLFRHLVPWILFWFFTPCKLVLSYLFLQSVWYFLHTQSIFNQSQHIQPIRAYSINPSIFNQYDILYLLKAYWAWCPGSCVWRWPPRPRWSLPPSSPQLLSWSGSSHAPPGHNWGVGGVGSRFGLYIDNLLGAVFFFHFDLFMGIFIIGCLLLMITLVSTWYASCTSWSFCIWPVRPGNSLSWANITLRALDF